MDVGVAPGLRGAVRWSPTPPSIGHVIATVVWVRAVLIPEGGGHKSQTQKEPELPLQNMDKGTRGGTWRIWSLTQGIKGTKEWWVCGMTEARKQPAFSRGRPEGPEVRKERDGTSPISPHALLWGTKFVSRRREALPSVPVIVSIFTPTAALSAAVPLSGSKNKFS